MELVCMSGPVVSIETMNLAYIDKAMIFRFTHEVLWVREVITNVSVWHGSHKVCALDTIKTNDRSVIGALHRALSSTVEACVFFGVAKESTMWMQIDATVQDVPVRRNNDESFGIRTERPHEYHALPKGGQGYAGWWIDEGTHIGKILEPRQQIIDTTVWSSKLPFAINALVMSKFKKRWNTPSLLTLNMTESS